MSVPPPELPAAAVIYDSGDTACGETLIDTLDNIIAPMAVGAVLLLVNSDPAAPLDLRAWAKRHGHAYLGESTYDGRPAYYVRKERE
jgi:tRNA 2-thiouridine synthesizing protein A